MWATKLDLNGFPTQAPHWLPMWASVVLVPLYLTYLDLRHRHGCIFFTLPCHLVLLFIPVKLLVF